MAQSARRATGAIGLIAVIVIASVFGAYVFASLKNPKNPITQTGPDYLPVNPSTLNQTAFVINETSGLETILSLNATSLPSGQWVSISIIENNTLTRAVNVSASQDWRPTRLSLNACSENYPIGVGVYEGYYTMENISGASEANMIHFIHPGVYNCPAIFFISSYVFEPSSDLAYNSNFLCTGNQSSSCLIPMSGTIDLNGSWSGGDQFGNGAVDNALVPGIYTVIGANEWGDTVLLYFIVSSNPSATAR